MFPSDFYFNCFINQPPHRVFNNRCNGEFPPRAIGFSIAIVKGSSLLGSGVLMTAIKGSRVFNNHCKGEFPPRVRVFNNYPSAQ